MARTTTIRAWPFLVSTNATQGFVTILAPQFLVEAGVADLLRRVTDGEVTPEGAVNLLAVTGLPTGALVLAYRISVAPGALIDSPDEILFDRQGRRILLVEGVVVEATSAIDLTIGEADFAAVRVAYRPAFRRVWEANDEVPVQASLAIGLAAQGAALVPIRKPAIHLTGVPARLPQRAASPNPTPDDHPGPPALPPTTDPPTLLVLLVVLGGVLTFLLLAVRLLDHPDLA